MHAAASADNHSTSQHQRAARCENLRFPAVCLAIFLGVWLFLAWSPSDRPTWLLENLPTFVIVPCLAFSIRRFRFSNRAYLQGLLFLVLHTIGAHYTYSLVPVGEALRALFGFGRNHYDRIVHFAFGLLAYGPVRELAFHRAPNVRRFAQLALSFTTIAFFALGYELVEWWVAVIIAPEAGTRFLATQGDEWDAQQDMAMACAGALIAAAFEFRLLRRLATPLRLSLITDSKFSEEK